VPAGTVIQFWGTTAPWLQAVFIPSGGLPITGTVTVSGRILAQVGLFVDLSWDEVNAACPEQVCSGKLDGYDMAGWTWASILDVNDFLNLYLNTPQLGVEPD